jgi:hypothetical protein
MTPEKKAEYYKLAQEVMEPVLTVAARRLGLAVEEIHATQIKPLREAASAMLAALKEIKRTNQHYNFGSKLLRIVDPAIAQAEAAGIKEDDQ